MADPSDFGDDAPTELTRPGALPELEDEDETTPRRDICVRCARPVKTGGDAARPTFEEMEKNAADACWRSLSGAWTWCSGRRPFVLTLTG